MVEVIVYCRSILRFGRQVAKVAILDSKATRGGDDKDDNKHNSLGVNSI